MNKAGNDSKFDVICNRIIKNAKHYEPKCSICMNRGLCFNNFPTLFEPFPCDGFEVGHDFKSRLNIEFEYESSFII
jgi:hypothetical protein